MRRFVELGDTIFTVRATKPNLLGELVYTAIGNSPATTYFRIEEDSGEVKVAANLTRDQSTQYQVRPVVRVHTIPGIANS